MQIFKLWLHTTVVYGGGGKEKARLSSKQLKPTLNVDYGCISLIAPALLVYIGVIALVFKESFFAVVSWIVFCCHADHWLNSPLYSRDR